VSTAAEAKASAYEKIGLGLGQDTWKATLLRNLLSVVLLLVVWDLGARYLVQNKLILVPPIDVLRALIIDVRGGEIWQHSYATLGEIFVSFPVAVAVGVFVGVVLSANRLVSQIAEPLLTAFYSVPMVALAPLFIAWLGLGFASKFAIILLVSVFPVIITTEVGLRSTDKVYLDAARSFNATRLQIFTTVQFPFALPYIIGGVRVSFARALVGAVVAEFFGAFAGYGYAILAAGQNFNTARLLGYVVLQYRAPAGLRGAARRPRHARQHRAALAGAEDDAVEGRRLRWPTSSRSAA
jgi:ABC-type nitrate/sulfonate/bicarbonate transport system permease component